MLARSCVRVVELLGDVDWLEGDAAVDDTRPITETVVIDTDSVVHMGVANIFDGLLYSASAWSTSAS